MKKPTQNPKYLKQQRVRIVPKCVEMNQSQNLNNLILSVDQIYIIRRNISIRLECLAKKVNEPNINQYNQSDDPIIKQLQQLNKEAKTYEFNQIEREILLVEGKRLLYMSIQSKRRELEKKKNKKEEIEESMFRYKKIKKFDYQGLIKRKLKEDTYISPAYHLGEGFQQTQNYYKNQEQIHTSRLQQCEYIKIIKEVNKIYMKNYSGYKTKGWNFQLDEFIIYLILLICLSIVVMGIMLIVMDSVGYFADYLLTVLIIVMLILSILGIKTFVKKPNKNNQFQQTQQDVKKYFDKINEKNQKLNKKFIWSCDDDFMYLQVSFKSQ